MATQVTDSIWQPSNSVPKLLVSIGDQLLFCVNADLWITDGTVEGTAYKLTLPLAATRGIYHEGTAYVAGTTGLYRLDANLTTATLVISGDVFDLAIFKGSIAVAATSGYYNDRLYITNGQPGDAVQLTTASLEFMKHNRLHVTDDYLYLSAKRWHLGSQMMVSLHVSDGTPAGTRLLMEAREDYTDGVSLLAYNNTCLFSWPSAGYNSNWQLMVTNGTDESTTQALEYGLGPFVGSGNGNIYFRLDTQLWKHSTVSRETTVVCELAAQPFALGRTGATIGDDTYFVLSATDIWKANGTTTGTSMLHRGVGEIWIDNYYNTATVAGNTCYFPTQSGRMGPQMWYISPDNIVDVVVGPSELEQSSNPENIIPVGNNAYFISNGYFLARSDGSASGTAVVTSRIPGYADTLLPFYSDNRVFVPLGELFSYNINTGQTRTIELNPASYCSAWCTVFGASFCCSWTNESAWPYGMCEVGGVPHCFGSISTYNSALFALHDTSAQIVQSGLDASGKSLATGNSLYFGANGSLWSYSGGTTKTLAGVSPSATSDWANVNGAIYFCGSGSEDIELWRSDEAVTSAYRVKDIAPGASSSSPADFCARGNYLYFTADDGIHGRELWRSGGTADSTEMVLDINPGPGGSDPSNITNSGTFILFSATAGNGRELWRSGGTSASTWQVSDIEPGQNGSDPDSFVRVNSLVYFTASTTQFGRELWQSDGTGLGTVLVQDLRPGTEGSNPLYLTPAGSNLFFSAHGTDGLPHDPGVELWALDIIPYLPTASQDWTLFQ